MFWDRLFKKKKKKKKAPSTVEYSDLIGFSEANLPMVKKLLGTISMPDRHKRLQSMAEIVGCQYMLLLQKEGTTPDRYTVLETSDISYCPVDTSMTWLHSQPAASNDASSRIDALPCQHVGAVGFVSVPIKDRYNVLTGIMLGISTQRIDKIDERTKLLHMIAPLFAAEIECRTLANDNRQQEQRIQSLHQSIEVMTADMEKEREKSKENKELKTVFLTNLSHEIRTPMNVVMGFLDLLETATTEEDRRNFIGIIKQNSQLMLTVVDNLVEMSKLQTSYMFRPAIPQQLNMLLDNIKAKYSTVLLNSNKNNVKILSSYSLTTPNDTIWNSDEIITRVFEALLDNACKYTNEGEIMMGYISYEKEMVFYVRDTGCGIKPGQEKVIFNMFNASDNPDTDDPTMGLGLAMAYKYVSLTSGKIWVDTKYEGGASFYFSIPNDKL